MRKTVCLIGRPNTGKSTLFNRLIKERRAIVDDIPGVTRDRIYDLVFGMEKVSFSDTGGNWSVKETFNDNIKMQAELAIEESDVIVLYLMERRVNQQWLSSLWYTKKVAKK